MACDDCAANDRDWNVLAKEMGCDNTREEMVKWVRNAKAHAPATPAPVTSLSSADFVGACDAQGISLDPFAATHPKVAGRKNKPIEDDGPGITLAPATPATPTDLMDTKCVCGHRNGIHSWAGKCLRHCDCQEFRVAEAAPATPADFPLYKLEDGEISVVTEAAPTTPKLTTYQCECGRSFLVEGQVIGKEYLAPPAGQGRGE